MAEPYAPILARRVLIGGSEETTAGTPENVTAAFAGTWIDNIRCEPDDLFTGDATVPPGSLLGELPAYLTRQTGTCSFRIKLGHDDVFIDLLSAFGYKLDTGARTPETDMSARKTWTLAVWEGGLKKILYGAVGNSLNIEGVNGQPVFATLGFIGLWSAVTDVALPSDPTRPAPYILRGSTFTLAAAAAPHISRIGIDLGISAMLRPHVTAATGFAHGVVTDINPRVTLDHEARTVAQYDAFGGLLAGTTLAMNLVLGTGGNTLTVAATTLQRRRLASGNRDGILTHEAEFAVCNAAMTFTEA
jgi:hypothetical protein